MQIQSELIEAWKRLLEITAPDDLKSWILEQGGEGYTLELKQQRRGDGKKEDPLPKAVCALANSDGGIIIIGVVDPSNWGTSFTLPQKEEKQSIRDEIRDAYIHRRPEIAVEFNEVLEITTILVKGNSPEPLLIKTPERLIGGYRRKGDTSEAFRPEEVVAYCAGWKHQYDSIIQRYRNLPIEYEFATPNSAREGVARFFVNTIPVTFIPRKSFLSTIEHNLYMFSGCLPQMKRVDPANGVAILSFLATDGYNSSNSVRVSSIGSGSYVLEVHSDPVNWDIARHQRSCVYGLYMTFALSNYLDESTSWTIQGFYHSDQRLKSVSHEPLLFQLPLSATEADCFYDIRTRNGVSEFALNLVDDIIGFLGCRHGMVFYNPSMIPRETELLLKTSPWG
jgi:hypothetical protein